MARTVEAAVGVGVADLSTIVGAGHVHTGTAHDEIDGVRPVFVVEPDTVEEAAAVLRLAAERGLAVSPRGAGTKLGWGNPPERVDIVLSTRRLDRVLEHAAGDLVVSAQAGVRLSDLQDRLRPAGQMLALDPPEPAATLAGVVAANAWGPGRLRYGTARDLLIGLTVVLADGTVAKAGGKVVKNVAGYDLGKLFTGSLGTLGLIAEVTFRLHPVPAATRTVRTEVATPAAAHAAVVALTASPLVPTSAVLKWAVGAGPASLCLRFDGVAPGVESQANEAIRLLGGVTGASGAAAVEGHSAVGGDGMAPGAPNADLWIRLTHPVARLDGALESVRAAVSGREPGTSATAQAVSGVTDVRLPPGDTDADVRTIEALRTAASSLGGSAAMLAAPRDVKRRVDAWGPAGDALALMRRVKERFDPGRVLNPGRFVGGI